MDHNQPDNNNFSLKQIVSRYEAFVRVNPRLATELESLVRWSSYLISTKRSPVLGELLYSGANLLQICNDILVRQSIGQLKLDFDDQVLRLRTCLAVIQSFEIFSEITARHRLGVVGRWTIITMIQITKATIKLTLLLKHKQGIQKSQPLIPIDRIHLQEILANRALLASDPKLAFDSLTQDNNNSTQKNNSSGQDEQGRDETLTFKTTGRKMRKIKNSPSLISRFPSSKFAPKGLMTTGDGGNSDILKSAKLKMLLQLYREQNPTKLSNTQIYGEMLHIARPLAHLALMGMLGSHSWMAYFSSMLMDLTSLHLVRSPERSRSSIKVPGLGNPSEFTLSERLELGGRAQSLLLYLLRSPFFDKYTKTRALEGLASASERIPIAGRLIGSFVNYIPEWQENYFRLWSD